MDLSVTFSGAFLAGLLSFASPCILPIVPSYLAFLSGVSFSELKGEGDQTMRVWRRVVWAAIAFVMGFSVIFVIMGASASYIGELLREYRVALTYIAGVIIILMGLHFLGLLRIGLLYRQARLEVNEKPVSFLGAFVVGLAFGFGWSPCAGPVLSAILFMASSMGDPAQGALLLFVYSMGIGVPFVLAAAFSGPFLAMLQRNRAVVGVVEKAMGLLLVVTGVLFLTGDMQQLGGMLLEVAPWLGKIG